MEKLYNQNQEVDDLEKVIQKQEKDERNITVAKQFNRLKYNIYYLRNIYGETRAQLAKAIGVSPSTIGNYENGIRFPERTELYLIAKHYKVTISKLLEGDFSNSFVETDWLINDVSNRELVFSTLLPIVYTDEAKENPDFKEAFDLHCKIYRALCRDDNDFAFLNIDKCTRLYQKALEDNIIEARANLLWWPMYRCIGLSNINKEITDSIGLKSQDSTIGDMLRAVYLTTVDDLENDDFEEQKEEFIRSYLGTIITNIYLLKNTHDLALCELADYYTAIAYKFNVMGHGRLTIELGNEIGEEMLLFCNFMKNPYAEKYYALFKKCE